MRFWFFCALFTIASAFPVLAAPPLFPQGDYSELRKEIPARVSQVIDPLTLALDDKRIVRLTGLDIPDNNAYKPGNFAVTALKILRDMLENKSVNLYQVQKNGWGQSNRMGQQLAHIERQSDKAWVQGTLLALGLARVMTDQRNFEMADQMYAIERRARAEKLGLWSKDDFKILTPEEAEQKTGTVQIVEGTVHSAMTNQNTIYLNFGPDWRADFTVIIKPENRPRFFKRNVDPLQWNNKKIRVRGWIGNYNGPYIEVDHPEQIEILDVEGK